MEDRKGSNVAVRLEFSASSEDEATANVSQEPLTLPSAMNHRQVVFHKRTASLYFALKSSSKFLFYTMLSLVLRSVGFNPLQVGILRATSALSSIMFVEFAMICIRSPRKRKFLAHLCLVLASASVLAYLTIPPAYERSSSTSQLMSQQCHAANYSLNVNGSQHESDPTDDPRLPSLTEPSSANPVSEWGTTADIVAEEPSSQSMPNFSQPPNVAPTRPDNSISPGSNIKVATLVPQPDMSRFPTRGGIEPDWVKGIIDAQNKGADVPRGRQKRELSNVVPDERSERLQQRVPEQGTAANLRGELSSLSPPTDGSSPSALVESFWLVTLADSLNIATLTHSLIVACFLTLSAEVYFALTDRISSRLHTDFLDQIDKNFDHLPFAHFTSLFALLTVVIIYVHYQCSVAPGFGLPTTAFGACGILLGLATVVFTCFPVAEPRKILDRDSVNPVKLTVYGNLRAMLIFVTLVVLGSSFGVEQNFVLWHLVENGADIAYVSAFVGIPLFFSAFLIARMPKRILNLHRFLLTALVGVSIRFVCYSFYSSEGNVKWSVLASQVVAPLSSTLLWKAVDSFLQQITFPSDHAPISRSMRFAFWGLGFSSGSLLAGYAWEVYKPSFFLLVVGLSVGAGAIALSAINVCVRIQDMKESHYMRILETDHQNKQPMNGFEETDDSEEDENDQVVEFQVKTSNRQ